MSSFGFSRLVISATWMFSSLALAQLLPIGTVSRIDSGPPPALAGPPIGVDDKPLGVAITPDGASPTENRVLNSIPLDGSPEALTSQTTPDGLHTYLYVTLELPSAVQVIDVADFSFVTRITVGTYPEGIAAHPDPSRQRIYVTNALGNSVTVIDTGSNTVVREIGVGENPQGIAFSPAGEIAYVANMDSGTISVIDTSQEAVVNTIDARELPYGIAFTPDGSTTLTSPTRYPATSRFVIADSASLPLQPTR